MMSDEKARPVRHVIIGPNGLVYPVQLEKVPHVGELISIENLGGFRVLQIVHSFGSDEEGRVGQ